MHDICTVIAPISCMHLRSTARQAPKRPLTGIIITRQTLGFDASHSWRLSAKPRRNLSIVSIIGFILIHHWTRRQSF